MPKLKLNILAIKDAARERWPEIISVLGNIDQGHLDGKHHSCPKCGGKDRFRSFTDNTGGAICNQCFSNKNGDGFAVLQWLTGKPFKDVAADVAAYVGITVNASKSKEPPAPAKDLEFFAWNKLLVDTWCRTRAPIVSETILLFGAKLATYRQWGKSYPVIALPIWGEKLAQAKEVGWVLYPLNGGTLPAGSTKTGPKDWVKMKTTYGSKSGVLGPPRRLETKDYKRLIKTEGVSDALAAASIAPDDVAVMTNAAGASERPAKWMADLGSVKDVVVIHDCDAPGQDGATYSQGSGGKVQPGWCPAFNAAGATSIQNVILPYEITPDHGKDLRDWLSEPHDWQDLLDLIRGVKSFQSDEKLEEQAKRPDEHPDDPHRLARLNIEKYRLMKRELRYWNETWYTWKEGQYREITKDHLTARIANAIREEFATLWEEESAAYEKWVQSPSYDEKNDKGPPKVRKVSSGLIRDVVEATKGMSIMNTSDQLETWLDDRSEGCISVGNGILDLGGVLKDPTKNHLEFHSPEWFSTIKLPYNYDPYTQCPTWAGYLKDVFNEDEESIDALQKWMGYLLTPDISLHKIVFVIGERRSGKGTISGIIRKMLGESNVGTPTLSELAGAFGLESLLGKTAALIQDARLSSRVDDVAITERLLSISGADPQNVARKFKPTLSGQKMPVRFTLFSNVLPMLKDHSSAFSSRCIFLRMPNSYYGREDPTYGDRLEAELSGILNWTIEGRRKLNKSKVIQQPASGMDIQRAMEMASSPVLVFLRERCDVGVNYACGTNQFYEEWKTWAEENDVKQGNASALGKNLRAVHPGIDTKQIRTHMGHERKYLGVQISPDLR